MTNQLIDLQNELQALRREMEARAHQAGTLEDLEAIRVEYLGQRGKMTAIMRGLKDLPPDQKPVIGAQANDIKNALAEVLENRRQALAEVEIFSRLKDETIDVTMPGIYRPTGGRHPLSRVTEDICAVFMGMGFDVIDDDVCPEVETDYYNFQALNFPEHHPARDMQDTFYTDAGPHVMLRSQTSNAQIRYMESHPPDKGPVRIISPGRVYRNEEVNSRKFVLFHQVEGLLVDEHVRFSDLKGVLHEFTRQFFGKERPTRFRASFFPFTEPSAEVDVQCIFCEGKGCQVCGHVGWLEILGAGLVDPNVLENVGVNPTQYTGFAFGMGVERLAMLKYGINDIRLFFNNDLRFLKQFKGL